MAWRYQAFFFFFKWPVEQEEQQVVLCRTHEWAHSDANKFYIICDGPESIILHNHYQPACSLPSWLNLLGYYVCCQEENQPTKGSLKVTIVDAQDSMQSFLRPSSSNWIIILFFKFEHVHKFYFKVYYFFLLNTFVTQYTVYTNGH